MRLYTQDFVTSSHPCHHITSSTFRYSYFSFLSSLSFLLSPTFLYIISSFHYSLFRSFFLCSYYHLLSFSGLLYFNFFFSCPFLSLTDLPFSCPCLCSFPFRLLLSFITFLLLSLIYSLLSHFIFPILPPPLLSLPPFCLPIIPPPALAFIRLPAYNYSSSVFYFFLTFLPFLLTVSPFYHLSSSCSFASLLSITPSRTSFVSLLPLLPPHYPAFTQACLPPPMCLPSYLFPPSLPSSSASPPRTQ